MKKNKQEPKGEQSTEAPAIDPIQEIVNKIIQLTGLQEMDILIKVKRTPEKKLCCWISSITELEKGEVYTRTPDGKFIRSIEDFVDAIEEPDEEVQKLTPGQQVDMKKSYIG